MPKIKPLHVNGSDSLALFLKELADKHRGQEYLYIKPLIDIVKEFEIKGPLINKEHKNFVPFKKIEGKAYSGISELRTKKVRYFLYKDEPEVYIGLHGFEKKSNDTPGNELIKAKREKEIWICQKKKLLLKEQDQSKIH